MARRRYQLDSQLVTLFFFVAMPLAAFGSFVVVSMARGALQESVGTNLEQRALETRIMLERYVGDQVLHLHLLSLSPLLRASLTAHTLRPPDDLQRLDQSWVAHGDPTLLEPLLASPLASYLREVSRIAPAMRLLQAVGADGRLVASSAHAGRLVFRDASWFGPMSRGETLQPTIGEVQRSPASSEAFIEIVYPVWDTARDRWIGAVRGLVAVTDICGILAPVRVARSEHALLLRLSDGLILASGEPERVLRDTYSGFSVVETAVASRRGHWVLPAVDRPGDGTVPPRLVGFSVVEQIPGVAWMVIVDQELSEAVAPVQGVTRYLWLHFLGAFASVFLLALYLSLRQEQPIIEEALHLHEDHVPPSMQRRRDDDEEGSPPAASA